MNINCNATGSERKRLVTALGQILGWEPVYQGAPSFGYAVGSYIVDRNGTIFCPDSATPEIVAQIISKLTDEGFTPEISGDGIPAEVPAEMPDVAPEAETGSMPEAEATEANVGAETPDTAKETAEENQPVEDSPETEDTLVIAIPRNILDDGALSRLEQIIAGKAELFKQAFQADSLPLVKDGDEVRFPWFRLTGAEGEAEAYGNFITRLWQMAVQRKRITAEPYAGDNAKFTMRLFLVQLGLKGPQYKLTRKILLRNLTGNSSWRYGAPPKNTEEVSATTEDNAVVSDDADATRED